MENKRCLHDNKVASAKTLALTSDVVDYLGGLGSWVSCTSAS